MVRVFVSSTFRDMQAERDHLVKFIFPQLRRLCEQRGALWSEVDLRWGITDEQLSEGQVLPICLAEIQRCRPYFIGLLGERYGWIPDEFAPDLVEREPWLAAHLQLSVTELEILHGVLNEPDMAGHALFYFRDPAYLETLDETERRAFVERPCQEEIERYGMEEAQRRAASRKAKLAALKGRIRDSGLPLQENYRDPRQLGEWLLADMVEIIERLFPDGTQPDPLQQEALEHEAFAASRAKVFIGGQQYFARMDAHTRQGQEPLVVLGESGAGKSALLANWVLHYRTVHPEELVLMHFLGAMPNSVSWSAMVRRIMAELQARFDIPGEIPGEPADLRIAFFNWLHMASAKGKVVLILDALNQLEDHQGAQELTWLPPVLPENVRLVLSTLPGKVLTAVQERNWPTLTVQPLSLEERAQLVREYLAQYAKQLSPGRVQRIISGPQSANPLALRLLLNELRQFGVHERLDEVIARYLEAKTIPDLFALILARCESDYEAEQRGLVRDALCHLWAARRGLAEAELLDLLGSDGRPLPQRIWSPLYWALEGALLDRGGLLGFHHDYIRRAVEQRYLSSVQAQAGAHAQLARYFSGREMSTRMIEELPWQLSNAGEWAKLASLLLDPNFFTAAWDQSEFDVKNYWTRVEENSTMRLIDAYRPFPEAATHNVTYLWDLARLLHESGHPAEALDLWERLSEIYRQQGDLEMLAGSLAVQAIVLREQGELNGAMALFEESERFFRLIDNPSKVAGSLTGQATILSDSGDLPRALALHQECARIFLNQNEPEGLAVSYGSQAIILRALGEPEQAMALHAKEERLCRELGRPDGLATSLGNQALIHHDRGNLEVALDLQREKTRICRELGNPFSLAVSLGNQAAILRELGKADQALALHEEEESICRDLRNMPGLATSLYNQAAILQERGDLDQAMAKYGEEDQIRRMSGDREDLAISLSLQADILCSQGNLQGAIRKHAEIQQISRELGNLTALAISLDNQAAIYLALGDLDRALAANREGERTARQTGNSGLLAQLLINQAFMWYARRASARALQLAEEAYQLAAHSGLPGLREMIEAKLQFLRLNTVV
jgi:tetratricopeptide (TPR) repeat protein